MTPRARGSTGDRVRKPVVSTGREDPQFVLWGLKRQEWSTEQYSGLVLSVKSLFLVFGKPA